MSLSAPLLKPNVHNRSVLGITMRLGHLADSACPAAPRKLKRRPSICGRPFCRRLGRQRAVNITPYATGSTHLQNGASKPKEDDMSWAVSASPAYLQEEVKPYSPDFCKTWDEELNRAEGHRSGADATIISSQEEHSPVNTVWPAIRLEATKDAANEPLLSSFLYASILAHDTFERALAFVLSNRLANTTMLATQLFDIFHDVLSSYEEVRTAALCDIQAHRTRDPACLSYSHALLFYKGYHAIQTQRIAHQLWNSGRIVMALALQSRMSEVFAVDIHPAARLGHSLLLDHGTGVVVGETAVIGNNCSILQNVTLGGTGKVGGDRHPKIGDNVLIGASATVLGNIKIGRGSQIAAGSLVLKEVDSHSLVAGSPAKVVGKVQGNPAIRMQQWNMNVLEADPFFKEMSAELQEQLRAQVANPPPHIAMLASQMTASSSRESAANETAANGTAANAPAHIPAAGAPVSPPSSTSQAPLNSVTTAELSKRLRQALDSAEYII